MERFVDNLVKKPFQNIIDHFGNCKKRKRKDFESDGQEVSTILKKSSFYKRNQPPAQHFYSLDFPTQSENQFKKIKLSINETNFLNVNKDSQALTNLSLKASKSKFTIYYSQPREYEFEKELGESLMPRDFKLTKAPDHENSDISYSKNKILSDANDQRKDWGMTSIKVQSPSGNKDNPILADKEVEEEKKDEKFKNNSKYLLSQFDTAINDISSIPFDTSEIDFPYEKEFEEKLSISILKKQSEYYSPEIKSIDEDYQNEIGDMLLEKVFEAKTNFPLITRDQYKKVKGTWEYKGNLAQKIVQHPHISQILSYKNMQTLSGLSWLNDEVINAYISLINQRDQEILHNKIFIFNTFFYQKLESTLKEGKLEQAYRVPKRAKITISECQKVFIPINLNKNHWAFVDVDMKNKTIIYNDSMGNQNSAGTILSNINSFIEGIIKHEKSEVQDAQNGIETFTVHVNKEYPKQDNCSDCGVFTLKGIDYISRNLVPNFSANDMPYFRLLITHELILGKLLTPNV